MVSVRRGDKDGRKTAEANRLNAFPENAYLWKKNFIHQQNTGTIRMTT